MDKKSLEKMIRSIMGDLKSEAKEDHFSDSDGNSKQFFLSKCLRCICKICYSLLEPQPSTSSGRGLSKKSLKRLQRTSKKKPNKLGLEQIEERRKLFLKNRLCKSFSNFVLILLFVA